jgi:HAD superfamily hydrolase (TIGR01509 family)
VTVLEASVPELFLFDLGGVLVENVGFERFNALLPYPLSTEELKTRWLASPAVRSFETGGCSSATFAADVVAEYQLSVSPEAFLEAFTYWPRGLYPGAGDLLAQLRLRYRVACLSNSNAIHWQRFGGFANHFHISLSSHLLGIVKPDADCFVRALRECNADAARTVFFDDSLVNVEAARNTGMQAFHVNGLADVRQVLASRGWI